MAGTEEPSLRWALLGTVTLRLQPRLAMVRIPEVTSKNVTANAVHSGLGVAYVGPGCAAIAAATYSVEFTTPLVIVADLETPTILYFVTSSDPAILCSVKSTVPHVMIQATFHAVREARVQAGSSIVSILEVANRMDRNAIRFVNQGKSIVIDCISASKKRNVRFIRPVLRVTCLSETSATGWKMLISPRTWRGNYKAGYRCS